MGLSSRRLFLYSLVLVVYLPAELKAQTTTSGSLTGIVTDQSGAVLLDAVVQIKDNNKGRIQSTKTDFDGVYRFYFLAPDKYALKKG
jgi:hypothetical protein